MYGTNGVAALPDNETESTGKEYLAEACDGLGGFMMWWVAILDDAERIWAIALAHPDDPDIERCGFTRAPEADPAKLKLGTKLKIKILLAATELRRGDFAEECPGHKNWDYL